MANNTFDTEVSITFNGSDATYTSADGVTLSANGGHVVANHGETKGVCCVESGSTPTAR